jgi:hypothetical protein
MKFNYVLIFLALVFAVGSPATVTKTTYYSKTACTGRISEILWEDAACRVSPKDPTKQSYKFVKATDGKSYRANLYGYTKQDARVNRRFDTECSNTQLSNEGSSTSLNVCAEDSNWGRYFKNAWDVSMALFIFYMKVKVCNN